MKSFALILTGLLLAGGSASCQSNAKSVSASPASVQLGSVYDFTVQSLEGQPVALSQFKGKKVLIVNTASECGYTPQYKGLEQLSKAKGDKLVVVGFPCNQFGGQEPGSAQEIKSFCEKNYGVSFPMMAKVDVKGAAAAPLYQFLNKATGSEPGWNFCKYLTDENGKVLKFYPSKVEPMSPELLADIDK
jgi:glutathione peroxidase